MKDTNQNTRGSNSTANRCTSQRPDRPASRGGSPSVGYNDLFGAPATGGDDSTPGESPSKPDAERETIGENDLFGAPALGDEPDPNEPEAGPDKSDADPDKPDADPPAPDFEDLFGDRVLDSDAERDPFASNRGEAPAAPALPFTAQPAERAVYQEAYRAAYRYPDALMLVMQGIRKGLKRGKETAQREENRTP